MVSLVSRLVFFPPIEFSFNFFLPSRIIISPARHFPQATESYILRSPNNLPLNFTPINIIIDSLIHFAANNHIIASNQIQAMLNLGTGFGVLWCSDYAFDSLGENEVCELVG
jgi:hypothetical protein